MNRVGLVNRQKGFTIVELLIVVVVIAILAAITIVAYNGITKRAQESATQSAASQAYKKLATFAVDNAETYPTAAQLPSLGITNSGTTTYQYAYDASTPKKFCLTATSNNVSYFVSETVSSPKKGGCDGHSAGGVSAITNLAVNPSFETSPNGVSSYKVYVTRPNNGGDTGASYMRGTRNDTTGIWGLWWDAVPSGLVAGETYTFSVRIRASVSDIRGLRLEWRDGATSLPGSVTAATINPTTSWSTLSGTATAAPGATGVRVTVYADSNGTTNDYVDIDSVMITKGSTVYPYADGGTAGWIWNGTAGTSTSTGLPL